MVVRKAMSDAHIREVIGPCRDSCDGGVSWDIDEYNWYRLGEATISLDGHFTADQLEALAWAMRDLMP